jgi:hypothetical protein
MARKKLTKKDQVYLDWIKCRQLSTRVEASKSAVKISGDKEENRRRYPEIAAWIDKVREYFPGAKVKSIRPSQATHEQE